MLYQTHTLLGGNGFNGPPGTGIGVDLCSPRGLAVDRAGRVYVSDFETGQLYRLAPGAPVETMALAPAIGKPNLIAISPADALWVMNQEGSFWKLEADGEWCEAPIRVDEGEASDLGITAFTFDPQGHLLIASARQSRIYRRERDGTLVVVAGTGQEGYADGFAEAAEFQGLTAIAADSKGCIYVADRSCRIRVITPDGVVQRWAGSQEGHRDGFRDEAEFGRPMALSLMPDGGLLLIENAGSRIRRISPEGEVSTLQVQLPGKAQHLYAEQVVAGPGDRLYAVVKYSPALWELMPVEAAAASPDQGSRPGTAPPQTFVRTLAGGRGRGLDDGPPEQARLFAPDAVVSLPSGAVAVAESGSHRVRLVQPDGRVVTLAGSEAGWQDGVGDQARFQHPSGLAMLPDGRLAVADTRNNRIRTLSLAGETETLAGRDNWRLLTIHTDKGTTTVVEGDGTTTEQPGEQSVAWIDYQDGTAAEAKFNDPVGLAVNDSGELLVADSRNGVIRVLGPEAKVSTHPATGREGSVGRLSSPRGLALAPDGSIYVTEAWVHRISRITPAGRLERLVGGELGCADGGRKSARLNTPTGLVLGPDGFLYVADTGNHRICRVSLNGEVQTVAGGAPGYRDGPGAQARFGEPEGLAFDAQGRLLVADRANHAIRVIEFGPQPVPEGLKTLGDSDPRIALICAHDPGRLRLLPPGPRTRRLNRWEELAGRKIQVVEKLNARIAIHFEDAWVLIEGVGDDPMPYFKDDLYAPAFHSSPSHLSGKTIMRLAVSYMRAGGEVAFVHFTFDDGLEQWLEPYYGSGLRIS